MRITYPELLSGRRDRYVPSKGRTATVNKPKMLIVHHTGGTDSAPLADSSNFTFDQCNELHRVAYNFKSSLGYYVGYHYYIDKRGIIKQGRADTDEGAHTIGKNSVSIGICLAGNFDATLPTKAQEVALAKLLSEKLTQYKLLPSDINPHRSYSGKTCYGKKLSDNWARDLVKVDLKARALEMIKHAQDDMAQAVAIISQLN